MRKILFIALACYSFFAASGQQPAANPFPKTITVTGSAEMEVIPDEIYVNVLIREYQKRGEDKKELETLKANFFIACKAAGIADSAISIVSYTGFNNYYLMRKKKKNPDLNASITYQVKFSASKQMDDLIEKLDDEATQSFDIVNTSHSKMTEYRRQLKIGAVKAAKEKAIYLTEAIGEKLGSAITVKEPDESTLRVGNAANGIYSQTVYGARTSGINNDNSAEVDFKKIKLRYEVSVIFALQ